MSLCVIAPRLPPALDGIGDYCRQLWQHCQAIESAQQSVPNSLHPSTANPTKDRPWTFLVLDGAQESQAQWPEVEIRQLAGTREDLALQLEAVKVDTVILQYVGYGYDPNGAPFWLAEAVADWIGDNRDRRLIIMFHETWSSGKPWERAFWQMQAHQRCVTQLLKVTSLAVTSTRANAESLRALHTKTIINIIPIGVSFNVSPSQDKNFKQLLIFGKEYARERSVKTHEKLIRSLIDSRLIERVLLVGQAGKPESDPAENLLRYWARSKATVVTSYNFPSTAIPDLVTECGLALMHTQSTHLLKSTSFQLSAILGQVAIAQTERPADHPFTRGKHYLSYRENEINQVLATLKKRETLMAISRDCAALAAEYLSWPRIAQLWTELLNEPIATAAAE
jgi:hypothetical protein